MTSLPRSKIFLVLGFCLVLFLGNAGLLMKLQHMDPSQLHALPWYQRYTEYRALAFRPFTVLMDLVVVVYGLVWVFRPHKKPVSDSLKMGVLAVAISIMIAYALLLLFKL